MLLLLPLVGACLQVRAEDGVAVFTSALLLLIWMGWLLMPLWCAGNRSIGRVVAGLLAGIVLVDLLAVTSLSGLRAAWFLLLFAFALVWQRSIPAT